MMAAAIAFHAEHKPETITLADVSHAFDSIRFTPHRCSKHSWRAGAAHLRQGCRLVPWARPPWQACLLGQ
jgi:hypothetical protein